MRCLTDLDQVRLQHMDEAGIDHQVIALTSSRRAGDGQSNIGVVQHLGE